MTLFANPTDQAEKVICSTYLSLATPGDGVGGIPGEDGSSVAATSAFEGEETGCSYISAPNLIEKECCVRRSKNDSISTVPTAPLGTRTARSLMSLVDALH